MKTRSQFLCLIWKLGIALADAVMGNSNQHFLPKIVGEARLIKNLRTGGDSHYAVGVYKKSNGQHIVAKIWQGNRKDFYYIMLKREILVHQILSRIQQRSRHTIPKALKHISIPRYVGAIKQRNRLALLTEYSGGMRMFGKKSESSLKRYKLVLQFIQFLGSKSTLKERLLLGSKTMQYYKVLYPLLLLFAIGKRPRQMGILLRGAWIFFTKSISGVFGESALIHGDLHSKNMLLKNKRLYLIDLEQAVYTYSDYEIVTTLKSHNQTPEFRSKLLADIQSSQDKSKHVLLALLLINCATHSLAGTISSKRANLYMRLLKFGISIADQGFQKQYAPVSSIALNKYYEN